MKERGRENAKRTGLLVAVLGSSLLAITACAGSGSDDSTPRAGNGAGGNSGTDGNSGASGTDGDSGAGGTVAGSSGTGSESGASATGGSSGGQG